MKSYRSKMAASVVSTENRWKVVEVIAEGVRNARSATARTTGILTAVAIVSALFTAAELYVVDRISRLESEMIAAGLTVTEVFGSGIDPASCDRLAAHWFVRGAGVTNELGFARVANAPGLSIRSREVGAGLADEMLQIHKPSASRPQVWLGPELADGLDLTVGSVIQVDDEFGSGGSLVAVSGIISAEPMWESFANQLVVPRTHNRVASSCLVVLSPKLDAQLLAEISATIRFADSDEIVSVPLLANSEFRSDPVELLNSRLTQWGWVAGSVVLLGVFSIVIRNRRSEIALMRLFNMPRNMVSLALMCEIGLSVVGGGIVGCCLALSTASLIAPSISPSILWLALGTPISIIGTSLVGLMLLLLFTEIQSIHESLKDR